MSLWSTLKRLWTTSQPAGPSSPEPVYDSDLHMPPLGDTGHPGASHIRLTGGDRGPESLNVLREPEETAVRGF